MACRLRGAIPTYVIRRGGAWTRCVRRQTVLTVGLCTDQACGGAVEEREQARHRQADVRVGGPQVQRGEPGELDLQDVLGSHLHIRHLRHTEVRRQHRGQPPQRCCTADASVSPTSRPAPAILSVSMECRVGDAALNAETMYDVNERLESSLLPSFQRNIITPRGDLYTLR